MLHILVPNPFQSVKGAPAYKYNENPVVDTNLNFGAFFKGRWRKILLQTGGEPSSGRPMKNAPKFKLMSTTGFSMY